MVLPVLISNTNLVAARTILISAVNSNSAATGTPVKGSSLLVHGFGAASTLGAVPLAALGGEDPCIAHGEDGEEGEEGAG